MLRVLNDRPCLRMIHYTLNIKRKKHWYHRQLFALHKSIFTFSLVILRMESWFPASTAKIPRAHGAHAVAFLLVDLFLRAVSVSLAGNVCEVTIVGCSGFLFGFPLPDPAPFGSSFQHPSTVALAPTSTFSASMPPSELARVVFPIFAVVAVIGPPIYVGLFYAL